MGSWGSSSEQFPWVYSSPSRFCCPLGSSQRARRSQFGNSPSPAAKPRQARSCEPKREIKPSQTGCSKLFLFLEPGRDLITRKTYPPATRHRRQKSEPRTQHGQPDCWDPRSAGRRSNATGGKSAGGAAGKEQGRG